MPLAINGIYFLLLCVTRGREKCMMHDLINGSRYAIIEFKLGDFEIESCTKHFNKIERLINKHNLVFDSKISKSELKIITASKCGHIRDVGILVELLGVLKLILNKNRQALCLPIYFL